MGMLKGKYTGWGVRGRPFTPVEFKKAHIGGRSKSYGKYLQEFGRQYQKPKLRKHLLK